MLSGKDGGHPGQRTAQSLRCQTMRHEDPTRVRESFANSLNKSPTRAWHVEDAEEIILTYRKGHLGFTYEDLEVECIPF